MQYCGTEMLLSSWPSDLFGSAMRTVCWMEFSSGRELSYFCLLITFIMIPMYGQTQNSSTQRGTVNLLSQPHRYCTSLYSSIWAGCSDRMVAIGYWLPTIKRNDIILTRPSVHPVLFSDGVQKIRGMWQRRVTWITNWTWFDRFCSGLKCWFQNIIAQDWCKY